LCCCGRLSGRANPRKNTERGSFPKEPKGIQSLKAHRERASGAGLVFPNRVGKPLHPCNVATRVWQPLRERAGMSSLDMYSLRHTFASLGRVAGESAFNMSRMMGHSRSTLVDQVYASRRERSASSPSCE